MQSFLNPWHTILLWFFWTKTPSYRPLSQPPAPLRLCHLWHCVTAQKSAFKWTLLIPGTEKWHHHYGPQLHNHSLSGRGERQSLPLSHCNRCAHSSIEERAHGSRLTTIGRVVQSKTPEPETLSVLYGSARLRAVCVLVECFIGFVLAKLLVLLLISLMSEN